MLMSTADAPIAASSNAPPADPGDATAAGFLMCISLDVCVRLHYVRYMPKRESQGTDRPLLNVGFIDRRSSVLSPSGLACISRIPTINLTAGCAHGCTYCYIQGYRNYPGAGKVVVYRNTAELLERELERGRCRPTAVYFSPSSDLFQPIEALSELSLSILELLFHHSIGVVFLTKGNIPDPHRSLLRAHRHLVRAQVGVTVLDENISAAFEPLAPTPLERISQIGWLVASGINTLARIDPIIPGLGDDAGSLDELMRVLAAAGVRHVSASVLFLRPSLLRYLKANTPLDQVALVLKRFEHSARVGIRAYRSSVCALPEDSRRAILKRVKRIAACHGITALICACKNPDLAKGTCGIGGDWCGPFHDQASSPLFQRVGR